MTYKQGMQIARRHGLAREFAAAYRFFKPRWAFWRSESRAVAMALEDWDL